MFACERQTLNEAETEIFFQHSPSLASRTLSGLAPRPEQWWAQEPYFPTGPSESRPGAAY